jgi:hypothetical protein
LFNDKASFQKGANSMKTEEMDFRDFTHVEAGYACELEVHWSNSYSVSITAGDNLIRSVKVDKADGTLRIRRTLSSFRGLIPGTFQAKVTMPVLDTLDLSGASKGTVIGFSSESNFSTNLKGASSLAILNMSAGDMKFKLAGASRATGQVKGADAEFNLSGASRVELDGSARNIVIGAAGASQVDLASLRVGSANVKLRGASNTTVNLGGRLDANLSGASKLYWLGNPVMGDIKTAGASAISRK